MKDGKIYIPKDLNPIKSAFCNLVNIALGKNPNITLKEFAEILDHANRKEELEGIVANQMEQIQNELEEERRRKRL